MRAVITYSRVAEKLCHTFDLKVYMLSYCSMKHSNCYMVWGGDLVSNQQTRFSQEDMVVGCLVDLATGLMTFTANGKEINTFYQVSIV